jgi:hypothetical protein
MSHTPRLRNSSTHPLDNDDIIFRNTGVALWGAIVGTLLGSCHKQYPALYALKFGLIGGVVGSFSSNVIISIWSEISPFMPEPNMATDHQESQLGGLTEVPWEH